MSNLNFPEDIIVYTMDASDQFSANFTPDVSGFLQHIRLATFLKDTSSGTVTMSIYKSAVLRAQAIVSLEDIPDTVPWVGWVRFDFNKQPLTAGEEYEMRIETSGTVQDAVSVQYDYYVANTYYQGTSRAGAPAKFEIYYREI